LTFLSLFMHSHWTQLAASKHLKKDTS